MVPIEMSAEAYVELSGVSKIYGYFFPPFFWAGIMYLFGVNVPLHIAILLNVHFIHTLCPFSLALKALKANVYRLSVTRQNFLK